MYLPQQACRNTSFEAHIEVLNKHIRDLKEKGHILVIGDMNCHYGAEIGVRGWGKSTANAMKLYDMICEQTLMLLDITAFGTGPAYSFHVEGVGTSYVDHCIISEELIPYLSYCKIHNEHFSNMSDHLPISVSLQNVILPVIPGSINKRVAWRKIPQNTILEKYTAPLEALIVQEMGHLADGDNEVKDPHDIEGYINILTNSMLQCSQALIRKRCKGEKPYWNKELTTISKQVKALWKQWKDLGRPRGNHPLYNDYKIAKKKFRNDRHKAEIQYEQNKIKELCQSHEMDAKHFWHLVNRHKRGQGNKVYPLKVNENEIICDPDKIRKCWMEYFKRLYTPSRREHYDDVFKQRIDQEILDMISRSYEEVPKAQFTKYTSLDIQELVDAMKMNKAPGFDSLQPEHIKHGGKMCINVLKNLFNSICLLEHIPYQFKIGVIIPLPKADKDRILPDNNRGITLLGSIAKLYDKAVLTRIKVWVKENRIINDLQGANQEKCSSLHTNWLVRESIAHYEERGSVVYVALMDVAKAFDSIWHNGFFYLLYRGGLDRKLWRLVMQSYDSFQCCVSIGGSKSGKFEALQGFHQGAPLSMTGFSIYDNVLITGLLECIVGMKVGETNVTCPAFADDIVVMSTNAAALQVLLNKVHQFSCKWRLTFNANKCSIVTCGTDKTPNVELMLGNKVIKRSDGDKHLGTLLTSSTRKVTEFISSRIKVCKKLAFAIKAIGTKNAPVTPISASYVFKSVCLSKLLYGLEMMEISDTAMIELETFQSGVAKRIQCLPENCCNIGAVRTMGWISIRGQLDIIKLIFLWRLIQLPMHCIYKKVCVSRYVFLTGGGVKQRGPLWQFLQTAKKYNLMEIVSEAIETGEYMSLSTWKKQVKETVHASEERKWHVMSLLYPSLCHVRIGHSCLGMSAWWKYAQQEPSEIKKCKVVMQLFLGTHKLNSCLYRHRDNDVANPRCTCCMTYEIESVCHLLFKCNGFADNRKMWWNNVLNTCPTEMLRLEMARMTDEKLTTFILSGLSNSYTSEWKDFFAALLIFITSMYDLRCSVTV